MVAGAVRTKVERLSKVVPFMDWKNAKRVTESLCLSSLSFCLPVWGYTTTVQRICQRAMNKAIRMLIPGGKSQSMTEGLSALGWLNMTNLWRLEQIFALWRVFSTGNLDLIYDIVTRVSNYRYLVRADGLKADWWPRNGYGEAAFLYQSLKWLNELRIGLKTWSDDRGRKFTKKQIQDEVKNLVKTTYPNLNIR